ncbi:MAG: aminotransferase class V-fold PLP-dependent enzyme [Caldilineales bacterium]|nr:aminotransferase class V-fold PLP-dependent enzyme [Caldilineales bacterium]MDW8319001.1 aminotransferase class V-fold PLP-dependent enzyme [Anaerolineae bacterium]
MPLAAPVSDIAHLRRRIVGIDQPVPVLGGGTLPYVNLDNAASTPALVDVLDAVNRFLPYYASVHRGTGFKSRLSTAAYDHAHEAIGRFVGADLRSNTVIFGKNTTEAINKLSYRLDLAADDVVITTQLEHHSNDLPWRGRCRVVHVHATPEGRLDEEDFDRQLAGYAGRIKLVAVSGASNVTGFIQPIHRLAAKAHAVGAQILVDAAQLAPHRRVDMRPDDDPEHLDFVALSAHKMYAPFGTGALVGPKEVFLRSGPEYRGGGTVDVVTLDEVYWAGLPDREEAGSPNVIGAVAAAAAAETLMAVGMDAIAAHEEAMLRYALQRLQTVPGIRIYGETDPAQLADKVGVIPFNLDGFSHFLVAAILGYEGGIGVRSGCFCAHPYVVHLLQLDERTASTWREQILHGDRSHMPGMVRISFGCYTNTDDIDRLVAMLHRIARREYVGDYRLDPRTGEYTPANWQEPDWRELWGWKTSGDPV